MVGGGGRGGEMVGGGGEGRGEERGVCKDGWREGEIDWTAFKL